jgi:hypothetical protein
MHKFLRAVAMILIFVSATAQSSERLDVSMIQLIANPQQFDGKPIRLLAYLNLEFEGDALFLHREDFDKGLWSNALSISLEDHHFPKVKRLSRGYVMVEGIFSAKIRGHFGMFSGSVQQVTRIQKYERPHK